MNLLNQRYQIKMTLGQGGMGTTYAALDTISNQDVALKIVSIRQIDAWKTLELFKREVKVLADLSHPAIPHYLDYFEIDTKTDRQFCLVRELVEGQSLAEFTQIHSFDELTVINTAIAILEILDYLHSFNPAIIHRDIKPENIIRRSDGKIYLVDFGAIQNVLRNKNSFVSTFVGTLGYMPPEQLRGQVLPASDLYSLGCTLLFLITKRPPNELPISRLKINFREILSLSEDFMRWLDKIVAPFYEDRYSSAKEALKDLLAVKKAIAPQSSNQQLLNNAFGFLGLVPTTDNPDYQDLTMQQENNLMISLLNEKIEIENHLLIIEDGNSILFNCGDDGCFYPQRLLLKDQEFTLELICFGIIHVIQGSGDNLTVFVLEKEADTPSDDLYAVISDGRHHYRFATKLDFKQKTIAVQCIKSFLIKYA